MSNWDYDIYFFKFVFKEIRKKFLNFDMYIDIRKVVIKSSYKSNFG